MVNIIDGVGGVDGIMFEGVVGEFGVFIPVIGIQIPRDMGRLLDRGVFWFDEEVERDRVMVTNRSGMGSGGPGGMDGYISDVIGKMARADNEV